MLISSSIKRCQLLLHPRALLRIGQCRYSTIKLTLPLLQRADNRTENREPKVKLLYEGALTKRILYLKSLSLGSSAILGATYGYVIYSKGFSIALAGVGAAFTPFFVSPFIIAWFFCRYITKLHYDPVTKTFTAYHYGWLLNIDRCNYKKEDVVRSDFTSMLNTFEVRKKPFFLNEEDLIDLESVELYRQMVGLDKVKIETHHNQDSSYEKVRNKQ